MSKRKRGVGEAAASTSKTAPSVIICGGQVAFRGGPVGSILVRTGSEWTDGGELSEARTAAGVTVFDGSVVVIGGAGSGPTPANRKASVEARHLPARGAGAIGPTSIPGMGTPRMSPGVAVAGGALWAIGGW